MSVSSDQQSRIVEVIKEILIRRIESFPLDASRIRNAPFHDAFLTCFQRQLRPYKIELPQLIVIASWLHGFNTSLGTGFESLAHILSGGYKRKFSQAFALPVKVKQAAEVEAILRDLKAGIIKPNVDDENERIYTINPTDREVNSLEFTVDNYIETTDRIVAVEIKSVRPNSGEGRGEKQKILYAKAALKLLYPNKDLAYFVGFPFDPTSPDATGYDKQRFFNYLIEFKKFFDPEEVLLGSEFWDFLSGTKNTMEDILETIRNTVKVVLASE